MSEVKDYMLDEIREEEQEIKIYLELETTLYVESSDKFSAIKELESMTKDEILELLKGYTCNFFSYNFQIEE